MYYVIYDGQCNLCTNLVRVLETLDQGDRFRYVLMQDEEALNQLDITFQDCELGMILIDADQPQNRWQGSDAAEEIGRLLPMGEIFINAYRSLPGVKSAGDRLYEQIRDHRYSWFGKRSETYQSPYPGCDSGTCQRSVSRDTNLS
ncbi:MAG: thiol-disulfide oxidoreductase DCC family protein [Elainellaceae cyanobacterium]